MKFIRYNCANCKHWNVTRNIKDGVSDCDRANQIGSPLDVDVSCDGDYGYVILTKGTFSCSEWTRKKESI